MATELTVQELWQPFEPGVDGQWDLAAAAHLFRRAGFGADRRQLEAAVQKTPLQVIDELLDGQEPLEYRSEMQTLATAAISGGNVEPLSAWWVYRILSTPVQLLEKTVLFWHGHFATGADKVTEPQLMLNQNQLLRRLAFGDFHELVQQIAKDPAMLLYLDSASNRKAHPNENFARELMELFCLGEGQYTERDIRELARCFTGWEVRRGEYRFNRFQHDTGSRSFLGATGVLSGEEAVQVVLRQPQTAEFIVSKLLRYFMLDEPAGQAELLAPLAQQFRDDGLQIRPLLRMMLGSRLFFSRQCVGRKLKSPVELALGLLRCLEGSTNAVELAKAMQQLGQGLLYPPSVKGWDGGRTWINSSTLLGRSNLMRRLITSETTRFGRLSLRDYLSARGLQRPEDMLSELQLLLFAVPIPEAASRSIIALMKSGSDTAVAEGLHALCTLPEFQLC
ncbi:MAG: DUF1800 family protein [Planctomyces sp.]